MQITCDYGFTCTKLEAAVPSFSLKNRSKYIKLEAAVPSFSLKNRSKNV